MAPDPYRYFRLEAQELLEQFARDLTALEQHGPAPAIVQRMLRMAHTLKGAARVVKQLDIAARAHEIEDGLTPLRDEAAALPPGLTDMLARHAEAIGQHMRALQPGAPPPAASPATGAEQPAEGPRMIRAELAEMDALLDNIAEAQAQLHGLRAAGALVQEAGHLAELLLEQMAPRSRAADMPANAVAATAGELRRRLARLDRKFSGGTEQLDRELRQLHQAAGQLRLTPATALLAALERTARDAGRELGKALAFTASGGALKLDAHMLGLMQQALVQIVRNAVAHGLESEAARRQAGKKAQGQVSVTLARRGQTLLFTCQDDGGGIDFAAISRAAAAKGLLPPGAAQDEAALTALLLRGGISTAASVTGVSGRGVGLDVVRSCLAQLGGTLAIISEPGRFTRFECELPASFIGLEVLLVAAAGEVHAIPLEAVHRTLRLGPGDIAWGPAGGAVCCDGAMLPFAALPWLLRRQPSAPGRSWSAMVVAGAEGMAVLGVERLLGTALTVTRKLPPCTPASPLIAGAARDAEGDPVLLLDPAGLVAAVRHAEPVRAASAPAPVLVIDDSLTTRMLEQSILEAAGYEVDIAASAEAGLAAARAKPYRLFLVDVEMPGMDGFGFIEAIRADPGLQRIPAILVTSRASQEDRARGAAAGADGFIDKNRFDQIELLRLIAPLAGHR
jgi:two-component system, chemotaxis family, sensor kinase CheA